MLELCRIHCRERGQMYHQERMETEQQQIVTKLGEIPIINDAYTQVLDIYERTKGHNFLFRTYFGMAEYTAKAVAGKTVPFIYNGFQSHIDKVNNVACNQLEALEEKYPIITRPTEEVLHESKEQYDSKLKHYVDPFVKPAKLAVHVGKTAINLGSSVAATAVKPAVFAVNVGSSITSSVVTTSKKAVGQVASGVLTKGQQVVDAGLNTPFGQFWLQQFDETLEVTEKLLDFYYLPHMDDSDESKDEGLENEEKEGQVTRTQRVRTLAKRIQDALYQKAEGDVVRYRMMAGSLLHEMIEVTGYFTTLMKDGASMAWTDRKDIMDTFDNLWNKYVQFIPEAVRPQDPMSRMAVLLNTLTVRVGELFSKSTELSTQAAQNLSQNCQSFVSWCQQQSKPVTKVTQDVKQWSQEYISQLSERLPQMLELVQFLLDKVVDSMDVFTVDIPFDLSGAELHDVAMGNCNGMAVEPAVPQPVGNCLN